MVADTKIRPPRSLCPHCGRLPERSTLHAEKGVLTANYLCQNGHGWLVKWGDA